jgi:hypothetical protein
MSLASDYSDEMSVVHLIDLSWQGVVKTLRTQGKCGRAKRQRIALAVRNATE